MENLPMSNREFKDLHSWVGKQPKEYREKLAELTDYSSKSKEEILEAITQANEDRKNSVGGAVRIDTNGGTFTPTTKDSILEEYSTILKTYYGQEQKNKIKELKNSSLSATKGELNDWVKSFL
jgi:Fe-S-cluster formation regulator IscX/YfhJ